MLRFDWVVLIGVSILTVIGRQVDGVRVDEAEQMFESSRDLLTHIYGSKNEHINRYI